MRTVLSRGFTLLTAPSVLLSWINFRRRALPREKLVRWAGKEAAVVDQHLGVSRGSLAEQGELWRIARI